MRGKYKKKLNHMTSSGDPKKNDGTTVPKSNNSAQERQDVLAVYMSSSKSNPTKLQDSESGKQPDRNQDREEDSETKAEGQPIAVALA